MERSPNDYHGACDVGDAVVAVGGARLAGRAAGEEQGEDEVAHGDSLLDLEQRLGPGGFIALGIQDIAIVVAVRREVAHDRR